MDLGIFQKGIDFLCVLLYIKCAHRKKVLRMSPRTGRPKVDNPMNERLYVRVSKQEKDEIMKFSSESGYSILELIRAGIEKLKGQKK